jgi:hypothetical protein
VAAAVLAVIARHPLELDELLEALRRWSPGEVGDALARLAGSGRIHAVNRLGRRYWTNAAACYGDARGH